MNGKETMRDAKCRPAEVVLGVLRERGRKGLPCTQLYRQMFNRDLYLLAYGNIYSNQGAMTPGTGEETADGMSEEKIDQIIEAMRREKYRFAPARRTYIPKKNGKLRPLGMPSWSGKLVGEVVRLLLEAIYEPQFSDNSHGFRRVRGCHTALRKINDTWTGTAWFVEGDISDCFGSLDHEVILWILAEEIHDNRFLRLIRNMLKAGYLEDWEYHDTLSGGPQGGMVSPILSNVYLHKLDEFVGAGTHPAVYAGSLTGPLIPNTRGYAGSWKAHGGAGTGQPPVACGSNAHAPLDRPDGPRLPPPEVHKVRRMFTAGIYRAEGRSRADQGQAGHVPPGDPRTGIEPGRRPSSPTPAASGRGSSAITSRSSTPTRRSARAAGNQREDRAEGAAGRGQGPVRPLPGTRQIVAPVPAPEPRRLRHRAGLRSRVSGRGELLPARPGRLAAAHAALARRGVHAEDAGSQAPSTVTKMAVRHKAKIETRDGLRTCFEARKRREGKPDLIARFGGIILKRDRRAVIRDPAPAPAPYPRKELIRRLRRRECELCETGTTVAVHQVAGLKALGKPGPGQPAWAALMAKKRRKTLIVCAACHDWIHANPVAHAA